MRFFRFGSLIFRGIFVPSFEPTDSGRRRRSGAARVSAAVVKYFYLLLTVANVDALS